MLTGSSARESLLNNLSCAVEAHFNSYQRQNKLIDLLDSLRDNKGYLSDTNVFIDTFNPTSGKENREQSRRIVEVLANSAQVPEQTSKTHSMPIMQARAMEKAMEKLVSQLQNLTRQVGMMQRQLSEKSMDRTCKHDERILSMCDITGVVRRLCYQDPYKYLENFTSKAVLDDLERLVSFLGEDLLKEQGGNICGKCQIQLKACYDIARSIRAILLDSDVLAIAGPTSVLPLASSSIANISTWSIANSASEEASTQPTAKGRRADDMDSEHHSMESQLSSRNDGPISDQLDVSLKNSILSSTLLYRRHKKFFTKINQPKKESFRVQPFSKQYGFPHTSEAISFTRETDAGVFMVWKKKACYTNLTEGSYQPVEVSSYNIDFFRRMNDTLKLTVRLSRERWPWGFRSIPPMLSVYTVRPRHEIVFRLVCCGDLLALRKWIDAETKSILVCDEDGRSLLNVSWSRYARL